MRRAPDRWCVACYNYNEVEVWYNAGLFSIRATKGPTGRPVIMPPNKYRCPDFCHIHAAEALADAWGGVEWTAE